MNKGQADTLDNVMQICMLILIIITLNSKHIEHGAFFSLVGKKKFNDLLNSNKSEFSIDKYS